MNRCCPSSMALAGRQAVRLARRLACCWPLLAGPMPSLVSAQPEAASAAASVPAAVPAGLHFLFDASMSMCGYLRGDEPQPKAGTAQILLRLIRFASTQKDNERNDRVVLLRQRADKASSRDLVEPPADFPAMAAKAAATTSGDCAPFDGRDTNPVQVFDKPPFATLPRSLIFVSDLQFTEKARIALLDKFRQVALARLGDEPYSVGLASLAVPFAGPYFPIIETSAEFKRSGYVLPRHARPLHLLWILVGSKDSETGRRLFNELGLLARPSPAALLYGIRLMPVPSTDPSQWFTALPTPHTVAELFQATSHAVESRDSSRSATILARCVEQHWADDRLVVRADNPCRDGKPLFDGSVKSLKLRLPVAKAHGLRLAAPTMAGATLVDQVLELSLSRSTPAEWLIPLQASVSTIELDRDRLHKLSLPDDSCPTQGPAVAWQRACANQLAGRTFSYDTLVEQLAMRAQAVLDDRAAARRPVLRLQTQLQPPAKH